MKKDMNTPDGQPEWLSRWLRIENRDAWEKALDPTGECHAEQ